MRVVVEQATGTEIEVESFPPEDGAPTEGDDLLIERAKRLHRLVLEQREALTRDTGEGP
jgi:hypothetical protein